ncbi:MAG TPA: 3-hydroxybutyryl-CoA dehydrogenase [Candidatus Polarisedimenticolia bacterium]|nr:3-hydroxybutyryl-CoA dehydrogenase [Candidatus Polarisedimenticolia bacterium]
MAITKVGVLGCGLMGSGIAQVCAQAGHRTKVLEVSQALLDKGLAGIDRFLKGGVERGKIAAADREKALGNLHGTTRIEDLAECELIIEAVVEKLEAKRDAFRRLDELCPPAAIFSSNTSSLCITELAAATRRPARFVGLHFFNPVPLMKLVEVVRTIQTDEAVFQEALAFVGTLGKTAIRTSDKTGFIVNRLLVPYILDAVRALEEGVGSIKDIDEAMKLGCGYPMGPLTLLDLVGLDTTYHIANVFFDEFRESRFAAPPLLKRMVLAGFHGRKSGKGFYDYAGPAPVPNDFLLGGAQ